MSRVKRLLPIERASWREEHTTGQWGHTWQRDLDDPRTWYTFHEGDHPTTCAAQITVTEAGMKVRVYPDPERFGTYWIGMLVPGDDVVDAMAEAADELTFHALNGLAAA